jgi:hypothetical protein
LHLEQCRLLSWPQARDERLGRDLKLILKKLRNPVSNDPPLHSGVGLKQIGPEFPNESDTAGVRQALRDSVDDALKRRH